MSFAIHVYPLVYIIGAQAPCFSSRKLPNFQAFSVLPDRPFLDFPSIEFFKNLILAVLMNLGIEIEVEILVQMKGFLSLEIKISRLEQKAHSTGSVTTRIW
jgi:hypothetical protein